MAAPHPPDGPLRNVLVIRLSALGDVVRALPLLPPLSRLYPGAAITWLCEPLSLPVVATQPLVQRVLVFPRPELERLARRGRMLALLGRLRPFLADLRGARFDLALDAQGTLKSSLLMRLSGAPRRVGFARGAAREFLPGAATLKIAVPQRPISRVEKGLLLIEALGGDPQRAAAALPEDAGAAAEARRLWEAAGHAPRVLISPGTSLRQAYKRWPATRFGELARVLGERGMTVRIAWGPGEEAQARTAGEAAGGPGLVLPPTSIPVLIELLRQADLFVGNDSGPLHLAWLVGTRVVGLYGATDPVINAPWGDGHVQVVAPLIPGETRRKNESLMLRIGIEEVVFAVRAALAPMITPAAGHAARTDDGGERERA